MRGRGLFFPCRGDRPRRARPQPPATLLASLWLAGMKGIEALRLQPTRLCHWRGFDLLSDAGSGFVFSVPGGSASQSPASTPGYAAGKPLACWDERHRGAAFAANPAMPLAGVRLAE